MAEPLQTSRPNRPIGILRQEYEDQVALYRLQPAFVKRFLDTQAAVLAEAISQGGSQARFLLPDRVFAPSEGVLLEFIVPAGHREQLAGGLRGLLDQRRRTGGHGLAKLISQRLGELEEDDRLAPAARLLRYSTSASILYTLLPSGKKVQYAAAGGEQIPSIPTGKAFYLPLWVAFDGNGRLLVHSTAEAEACIRSMQRYGNLLHAAVALAPYMVMDDTYQEKRYGILGQLVNQGRWLALHETGEIINIIRQRASAQDLNRGLSVALPYFNDQELKMGLQQIEVIPSGRIPFAPEYLVQAARREAVLVGQDTRLSLSTRSHLLDEIRMLEEAF